MPQYNPTEQALLSLLQQERQRNGSVSVAEPRLPDINPNMFLSPAAQREIEAVHTLQLSVTQPVSHVPEVAVATSPRPLTEQPADIFSSRWDLSDEDFEPHRGAGPATPDLDAIFMGRALELTGGAASAAQRRAERLGDDFSFTAEDFEVDIPRTYEPPSRRQTSGTIVSQRGPSGFTPVQRVATPQRHAPAVLPAPAAPLRSRYERLLGPSIID